MLLGASWLCASKAAAAAAQSEGDDDRPGERRRRRAAGEDMDESSLLDLLECSVCLERLDTTAKVLPCQHTFCRRCLESIVCSRHELRCPECRILVGCGVDELPANILLVRLLDGIRQRPRAGASPGGSPPARPGPGPGSGAASALAGGGGGAAGSAPGSPVFLPAGAGNATATATATATASLRELATSRSAPVAKTLSQLPYGKALYSYEGKEPGDLKFSKGDVIILRRKVDEHWYHGELHGAHGFLPASYIQCVRPLPQTPPQGKALYDFEMKDRDQDKDCLTFTKDEILTVIRRVDDNWAEGMLGDKIGIFPLLYVELNDSAKQLMEMDKPCPAAVSGCHAPVPCDPGTAASVALGPSASSTGAVSAFQRRVDSKKNAKKRHSFTALSVTHKSSQATSHRHSMEISAPVLISSSDPRAAARIGDLAHLSCSAPTQRPSISRHGTGSIPEDSSSSAGPASAAEQQGTAPKVQLPLNVYLALYAYKPQKNDELELRKGEMYRVLEKCQDGWFKGTSLRTGLSGVFPGNYVTPVSRAPVGGAGPPRNNVVGGSPLAKGMATTIHPGGGSLSSPATATRPALPLTTPQAQHQAASPPTGSCLRHTAQPATSQARGTVPTEREEEWAAEASRWGFHQEEIPLPTVHLSNPRSPGGSRHLTPGCRGARSVLAVHAWQGRLLPHREQAPLSMAAIRPEPKPLSRERYRVVVSYPPQSEAEIELKEGDIVFVHKKREDGWYKGTLQRNGRTGLFPGSFVESF
ncbi:E3 ubiquitin-protein ligase SH3RF3 isoform X5 [Canis lupus dingo]|uniref:E3 ubiquitin-protein ligase SH3RF3 isoform X5 n=1 Tax=Canis lupus dingo TaxID=286419 RepID=UPI0020C5A360|nr:E3 ubiquitin-protein ligase SH3RF3 isoform X5 [Canis lupus dingo]